MKFRLIGETLSFFRPVACVGILVSLIVIGPTGSSRQQRTALVGGLPEQERGVLAGGQRRPPIEGRVDRRTIDDAFAEVARRVPGLGGMFIAHAKTLQVYLKDTSLQEVEAVRGAIIESFGRQRIPRGGIRSLKGQYGFLELKQWHDRARGALSVQ